MDSGSHKNFQRSSSCSIEHKTAKDGPILSLSVMVAASISFFFWQFYDLKLSVLFSAPLWCCCCKKVKTEGNMLIITHFSSFNPNFYKKLDRNDVSWSWEGLCDLSLWLISSPVLRLITWACICSKRIIIHV